MAYSVVHWGCATGYYSFGHEMGHNLGCQHDRGNASGTGAFPYSYGYQQMSGTAIFRTIMSYQCAGAPCTRINNWSNPDVSYQGSPTAKPSNDSAAADNRAT